MLQGGCAWLRQSLSVLVSTWFAFTSNIDKEGGQACRGPRMLQGGVLGAAVEGRGYMP